MQPVNELPGDEKKSILYFFAVFTFTHRWGEQSFVTTLQARCWFMSHVPIAKENIRFNGKLKLSCFARTRPYVEHGTFDGGPNSFSRNN